MKQFMENHRTYIVWLFDNIIEEMSEEKLTIYVISILDLLLPVLANQ